MRQVGHGTEMLTVCCPIAICLDDTIFPCSGVLHNGIFMEFKCLIPLEFLISLIVNWLHCFIV